MKSIKEQVENNTTYQKAIKIAPKQDQEKIKEFNREIIKTFESFADKLQQINIDPELRKNFLAELHKRKG